MNSPCSVYISRVFKHHTLESISQYMKQHGYGDVDSVDFIDANQRPGFIEPKPTDPHYKSAFVHFRNQQGDPVFWRHIANGERYRIDVIPYLPDGTPNYKPSREWWVCYKAHHPVPRTHMNIHQVVANCRHLELIIQTQNDTIQRLNKSIHGVNSVLYQLVTGLYSPHTQQFMRERHFNYLFPELEPYPQPELTEQQETNMWSTTLQCERLQHRITLLETQIQTLSQHISPPPLYIHPIEPDDLIPLLPPTHDTDH
jgi:hypothetical protein